ncbi:hypothetical protein [Burkholderia ubonensis]|uniref:hypothetical protein n=1 Tax=Burkholderia ubonensis TaxID=101571 RepID=UPI0012FA34A0|nr:hypothetical protein [Burkholderia ubonensis]
MTDRSLYSGVTLNAIDEIAPSDALSNAHARADERNKVAAIVQSSQGREVPSLLHNLALLSQGMNFYPLLSTYSRKFEQFEAELSINTYVGDKAENGHLEGRPGKAKNPPHLDLRF